MADFENPVECTAEAHADYLTQVRDKAMELYDLIHAAPCETTMSYAALMVGVLYGQCRIVQRRLVGEEEQREREADQTRRVFDLF